MNSNPFDKKIADIIHQNDDELPTMGNKEKVWKNIENKLQKPSKRYIFHYVTISAAACIALVIGSVFLFQQKEQSIATSTQTANQPIKIGKDSIAQVEKGVIKKEQFVQKKQAKLLQKNKQHLAIDNSKTFEPETTTKDTLMPIVKPEENVAMIQKETSVETEKPITSTPYDEIEIELSLSYQKTEKSKIKIDFMNLDLTKKENNTENKKQTTKNERNIIFF